MAANRDEELRRLPKVDRVLEKLGGSAPHPLVAGAARASIDEARASVLNGANAPTLEEVVKSAELYIRAGSRRRITPLVNATGVILHTNLGRSPLAAAAIDAIATASRGYSNLEYDLSAGARGSRYEHAVDLITTLTGAESALIVNNNAAAVLLSLAATSRGREVVISRGELIEIGGGFRIPEILAESGARLREVGTTNRTHLHDYERAIGGETASILKVHPSNYRVVGFATSVESSELARLAHDRGVLLIHDLGSGLMRRRIGGVDQEWLRSEPTVEEALSDGADVVTFSADKLLGGPQGGVILAGSEIVARMLRSPLLRAFRVDKMTLAALEATLLAYLNGDESDLPVWSMALTPLLEIEERARRLAKELSGIAAKVETRDGGSTMGGGSLPGQEIPTILVEVSPANISLNDLTRGLIDNEPPIIARIDEDRLVVDLRTVASGQDATVAEALRRLCTS